MATLLAVSGSSPGVGKSSLCAALAEQFRRDGRRVDHFVEEDLFARPEFEPVAAEFRATGLVADRTLLDASVAYVAAIRADDPDIVITDSLFPFLPSLLAWGRGEDEIAEFLDQLARILAPVNPMLIYLDGDPATALDRAAGREDGGWMRWYIDKMAGYDVTPPVHDVASAVAYQRHERDLSLRLLRRQPWHLVVIEHADARTQDGVREQVAAHLTGR